MILEALISLFCGLTLGAAVGHSVGRRLFRKRPVTRKINLYEAWKEQK
jgi:hypothetical protein